MAWSTVLIAQTPFKHETAGRLAQSNPVPSVDFTKPVIMFHIAHDGLYRIDQRWIASRGIPLSDSALTNVKLFRKGIEVPMHLALLRDADGIGRITLVFWGERNYMDQDYRSLPVSKDDPYPEYLNRYADSAAYFLMIDDTPAKRILQAVQPSDNAEELRWSMHRMHIEQDVSLQFLSSSIQRLVLPDWTSEDTWIMALLPAGKRWSIPLSIDELYPDGDAYLFAKVTSYQGDKTVSPNHRMTLHFGNGTALDDESFSLDEQVFLSGSIPTSQMKNGTDSVIINSIDIQGGYSMTAIDWIDIEYPRYLKAKNGKLRFSIPDGIAGARKIIIENIPAPSLLLRRTHDRYAVLSDFEQDGSILSFIDEAVSEAEYFVSSTDSLMIPAGGQVVSLSEIIPARYVAITSRELMPAGKSYLSFIEQAYNVSTTAIDVDELYLRYSHGDFKPEAIKSFLADAVQTWPVKPEYVLLIGDASYDYKNKKGKYRTNIVPSYGFPVSDSWFVSFDEKSMVPSLAIGRLPVRFAEEIEIYRKKHEAFLGTAPDFWGKTFLAFTGGPSTDPESSLRGYRAMNERIAQDFVLSPRFGGAAKHFYKTNDPPSDFGPFTQEHVDSTIREGAAVISFIGHSASQRWDNSITSETQLRNRFNRASLVTDFGCSSGRFAESDMLSFSELFVLPDSSPAIAYIGNSAFGFLSTQSILHYEFYRAIYRGARSIGEAHRIAKRALVDVAGSSVEVRSGEQISTLIGDPIVRLPIPTSPDLATRSSWIRKLPPQSKDSLRFHIRYANYGTRPTDSVALLIEDMHDGIVAFSNARQVFIPFMEDSVVISIPNTPSNGSKVLRVAFDDARSLSDSNYENNHAEYFYDRDTLRPSLEVRIDGNIARAHASVIPSPRIEFILNNAGRTDAESFSLFRITLNDEALVFPDERLSIASAHGTEPIVMHFSPQLSDGDHVLRYNAMDKAGNSALHSDDELLLHVNSRNTLDGISIYPHPLDAGSVLSFSLTGATQPSFGSWRIFSSTGREVHSGSFSPERLRLGKNEFSLHALLDGITLSKGFYFCHIEVSTPVGPVSGRTTFLVTQ